MINFQNSLCFKKLAQGQTLYSFLFVFKIHIKSEHNKCIVVNNTF